MTDADAKRPWKQGHITPDVAKKLLKHYRWTTDMAVINDFGEHVWLGPCYDQSGKRIGITDCCFVSSPCDHHKDFRTIDCWDFKCTCLANKTILPRETTR
jgi:hypothetical protein